MHNALQRIVRNLPGAGAENPFVSCFTASSENLKLKVDGVGAVRLPVTPARAQKLCEAAQPALHGYKEETRLDPKVRDTWEIAGSRVGIDWSVWQPQLDEALCRIRDELGLSPLDKLEAELHNLLVYAPGQFFAPHRDSEKGDGMIGSLVVGLPSRFTGGEFEVEHQGRKLRAKGDRWALEFVAFYADCRHQVHPVRTGHRVVLTWNLYLRKAAPDMPDDPVAADPLAAAVRDYFAAPLPPSWSGAAPGERPDRLVYLLDHQYTRHGLDWQLMKGADAARAAALRQVAAALDCEIYLAQADIHEHWICEDDHPRRRRRYRHWDDEYDDDDDVEGSGQRPVGVAAEPPLIELIESSVELHHWFGPSGQQPELGPVGVGEEEVCYSRASSDCEPFQSEHEGYTGNAGNTVDRWYHRAAVVMWPRERNFVIRARLEPAWALAEIEACLDAADRTQAVAQALSLLPFWASATQAAQPDLLAPALRTATRLGEAKLAEELLKPFRLIHLNESAAPAFAALLPVFGQDWCRMLLQQWISSDRLRSASRDQLEWVATDLPAIVRVCCAADAGRLGKLLLENRSAWLREIADALSRNLDEKQILESVPQLSRAWLSLLKTCAVVASSASTGKAVLAYIKPDNGILHASLAIGILRASCGTGNQADPAVAGLAGLRSRCIAWLQAQLARPPRAAGDWSIDAKLRCDCEACAVFQGFLRADGTQRDEWPLAEAGRMHVEYIIASHHLPVRHTTRRVGRPYSLLLEKTDDVFKRDAARRREWIVQLAWLQGTVAG